MWLHLTLVHYPLPTIFSGKVSSAWYYFLIAHTVSSRAFAKLGSLDI